MDLEDKRRLRIALLTGFIAVALIWLVKALEYLAGDSFSDFGIFPRRVASLPGILFAPLIHGDWNHLWSNSVPLFVSVSAIMYLYREVAIKTILFVWVLTGLWVWIGAAAAYHIGASGLVYGFITFLFFSGILRWETRSIAMSILVAFLYGGMVWGVLPIQERVSWESHLFGSLAGIAMAFVYRKRGLQRKRYRWEDEPETENPADGNAFWNYKGTIPAPPETFDEEEETP